MQRGIIIDERSLANIFGLDEIRVARRLKLNPTTGALEDIYSNVAVLFYGIMEPHRVIYAVKFGELREN